ncbi:MAG: hypothetical protein M0006_15440 [Magnetospirillum sp.]|nr:hypothetical protein [Magnetospirillum sp.]
MPLISDAATRTARAASKRAAVLRYLASEVWSTADLIGRAAGIGCRRVSNRLLSTLAREGSVRRAPAPDLSALTIWGITPHGRAVVAGMDAGIDPAGPVFEPGRVALSAIPHRLMIQRLRAAGEAAGWTGWTPGDRLARDLATRPDAIGTRPDGVRLAIEAERTVKTPQRYRAIVAGHLKAITAGSYAGVYVVAPPSLVSGLARIFAAVRLPGGGALTAAERKRFRVVAETDFPPKKKDE